MLAVYEEPVEAGAGTDFRGVRATRRDPHPYLGPAIAERGRRRLAGQSRSWLPVLENRQRDRAERAVVGVEHVAGVGLYRSGERPGHDQQA